MAGFILTLKNEQGEIILPYLHASFKKKGESDLRLAKAVFETNNEGIYVRRERSLVPTPGLTVIEAVTGFDYRYGHSIIIQEDGLRINLESKFGEKCLGIFGYGIGSLEIVVDERSSVKLEYQLNRTSLREFSKLRRTCPQEITFPITSV
jgi:hypothetical protein